MLRQLVKPGLIVPFRGAALPFAHFGINRYSPQANGLITWLPMHQQYLDVRRGLVFTGNNSPGMVIDREFANVRTFASASTQYLENTSSPITGYPFSITAWFNCTTLSGNMNITGIGVGTAANANAYRLRVTTTTFEARGLATGSGNSATVTTTLSTGLWYLGVGVFASQSDRRVFIAGPGVFGNGTTSTDIGAIGTLTTMRVAEYPSNASELFNGRIADARFYNRILTAADVYHMYNPTTRWDLYVPRVPKIGLNSVAAAGGPFPHYIRRLLHGGMISMGGSL